MNEIFISEKHPVSKKFVIFEDNGICGWLYITKPNNNELETDCWLYNKIKAPSPIEIAKYKDDSPPASLEYTVDSHRIYSIDKNDISFIWSNDGENVALLCRNLPLGFILKNHTSYSKFLIKDGPWGNKFNDEIFYKTFRDI